MVGKKLNLKKPEARSRERHLIASRGTLLVTIPREIAVDAGLERHYNENRPITLQYNKATRRIEICLEQAKPVPAQPHA